VIAVTDQIDTVNKLLASVNADHDKALAELAQQKAIVESAKAEAKRAKEVAESVGGKAREELAELHQKLDAVKKENDVSSTFTTLFFRAWLRSRASSTRWCRQ
jgi:hypothetical protein